jgi:hypothetical protein
MHRTAEEEPIVELWADNAARPHPPPYSPHGGRAAGWLHGGAQQADFMPAAQQADFMAAAQQG